MATASSAEEKAAPGFAEFRFNDGALLQVSAYDGVVTVLQQQGGTQGRGAAFISPDEADHLAAAIKDAGKVARQQAKDVAAAPALQLDAQPLSAAAAPPASAIDYDQLAAAIVRAQPKPRRAKPRPRKPAAK